jgi:hypothetical protein
MLGQTLGHVNTPTDCAIILFPNFSMVVRRSLGLSESFERYPLSVSDSNYNPQNTKYIPMVKIFVSLDLGKYLTFFKGLNVNSFILTFNKIKNQGETLKVKDER